MMVESLIVLVFITTFFSAGLFLYSVYDAKLQSFAQATGQAFQRASSGCGSGVGTYNIEQLIGTPPPDPLSDNPDMTFLGGPAATTNEQASFNGAKPALLGGGGWTVNSVAKVTCNEPPMTKAQALAALGVDDWSVDGVMGVSGL
jgi:hypothetical protein